MKKIGRILRLTNDQPKVPKHKKPTYDEELLSPIPTSRSDSSTSHQSTDGNLLRPRNAPIQPMSNGLGNHLPPPVTSYGNTYIGCDVHIDGSYNQDSNNKDSYHTNKKTIQTLPNPTLAHGPGESSTRVLDDARSQPFATAKPHAQYTPETADAGADRHRRTARDETNATGDGSPAQDITQMPRSTQSYNSSANRDRPDLEKIDTDLFPFSSDDLFQSPHALNSLTISSASTYIPAVSLQGTALQSLLDYLVRNDDPAVAIDRHGVICIASYVAFSTSFVLLEYLKNRYASNDAERSNILLLLEFWVCKPVITVDANCLDSIEEFALDQIALVNRTADASHVQIKTQARRIYKAITKRKESNGELWHSASRCAPKSPRELASTLTIYEGSKFKQALWDHCIKFVCNQGNHPDIQDVLKTNDKLKNWVMYCVLSKEEPRIRAREFKFFVSTAQECQKLGNFSSMCYIVAALSKIATLPTTFNLFSNMKGNLKLWNEVCKIRERSFYMEQLHSMRSSCVPILMLHLKLCKESLQGDGSVDFMTSQDGVGLVNIARWDHIAAQISELAYGIPTVKGDHQAMLSYIQDQFDTCNTAVTQAMMQRAASKEKQDGPMQSRRRGYENAGFS